MKKDYSYCIIGVGVIGLSIATLIVGDIKGLNSFGFID
tara:strand:- start:16340 stop:16453 length:114 start_codon:yes stop_codon:yes gene_type:complete